MWSTTYLALLVCKLRDLMWFPSDSPTGWKSEKKHAFISSSHMSSENILLVDLAVLAIQLGSILQVFCKKNYSMILWLVCAPKLLHPFSEDYLNSFQCTWLTSQGIELTWEILVKNIFICVRSSIKKDFAGW